MSNKRSGKELIAAFLEAIRKRQLEAAEDILRSLKALSERQPNFKPWCRYMEGYLIFEKHRWAEAEQIFSELLQTYLEPALRGRVIYAQGRNFDIQGRWQEALTAFEQYLSIVTDLDQAVEQARAQNHLASTLYAGFTKADLGVEVLQQAIAYSQSALDILEPIHNPPSDVAYLLGAVWNNLGLIHVSLGQWDKAINCYQQDLNICRAQDDRFGMGITYGNIGEVFQKQGQWAEALTAYQQALRLIRDFGGHYEEIDVLADLAYLYQEMGRPEQALDYYEQAVRVIEKLRAGVDSEEAQAGFFATVIEIFANSVLLCLETGQEFTAFDYVERARSRAFIDTLVAARSIELSETVETSTMSLTEVQAALPPNTLLLEYFTTGLVEVREHRSIQLEAERHRFPAARTLLFAVSRDTMQVFQIDLSPNDLHPDHLGSVVEHHFLEPDIQRKLYDQLIAPVENLMSDKERLYLVPHGPLHYIPFQTLLAPDGDTLLRENGPQLIYAPSATLLFRYGPTAQDKTLASCLAIGYNSMGATQLLYAEDEARGIAHLTGGQALVGSTAKKQALYTKAGNYRLLHLACHGEFDPVSPLTSFVSLAPDETLTALEVLERLRLQCDLVTLSACESGLSQVRRGDELVGFIRAFMYAGAPAVVSTLWRVNDRPTRILMDRFYQEIQAGTGFAEALKRAQLFVKNLTYQKALNLLTNFQNDAPEGPDSDQDTCSQKYSDQAHNSLTIDQADTYLRGVRTRGHLHEPTSARAEPAPDEKVFADPYYWGAFVLTGERGS